MIRFILNVLWFILGGWLSGLLWILGGCLMALTIVGLPWTFAAFRIAGFAFWPFGKEIVEREGGHAPFLGPVSVVLNVIWFIVGGWHIALSHLIAAFVEGITIVGLPFAFKDLQLASLAFAPVGREVVRVR